jgi:hypothetical protein
MSKISTMRNATDIRPLDAHELEIVAGGAVQTKEGCRNPFPLPPILIPQTSPK